VATPAAPVALMPERPGISKQDSAIASGNRWIDADKIIFVDGRPQKMAGWAALALSTVIDPIRGVLAWSTQRLAPFIAYGTHRKLYVADQQLTDPYDITPVEHSGVMTNPFTTTIGSADVKVEDTAHHPAVGDEFIFSGASPVGGITINGSYDVVSIIDHDHFTITHSTPASSSATGGGSVSYGHLLAIGGVDPVLGDGYGSGGYGLFDYGEPTEDTEGNVIFEPRVWSFDNYGDLLLANPVNNGIYEFNPNATPAYQRAVAITNAPTECRSVFVTPERFIFALGCDGDPMNIKWPDQNDRTNWTPGSASTANSRRLREGTRIITGRGLANLVSLVWTDTALYRFQYTGSSFVYDSQLVGTNCGLVSPMAAVVHQGTAYWMSPSDFLFFSGGSPQSIPNSEDVREFVIRSLRTLGYEFKCNAHLNTRHNYVFWFYVATGSTEPGLYVGVSLKDFSWIVGSLERTSGTFLEGSDQRPILAGANGVLYQHEEGVDNNGAAMNSYITRAPMQIMQGMQLGEMQGMVADFQRQTGDLTVEIVAYDRLREGPLDTETETIAETDDLVDLHIGGRLAKITIRSNVLGGDFRMGAPLLEVKAMGKRR
jgi:hypothetical protein